MRELSRKVTGIAASATIEISNLARQMERSGIPVINLSIGEPDFDTPQHIKDACIAALKAGETHYAPSNGIPGLLNAISDKVNRENHFSCSPDQVIITCGAKDAIYDAMEAVLNPGDEVIILDPAWVSYEPCVQIAGGKPVHHPLNARTFQVDDTILDRITPYTKMVVINSPSNPSGAVLNRASMKIVSDMCTDYDLIALSDEIYEKLIYEGVHTSPRFNRGHG